MSKYGFLDVVVPGTVEVDPSRVAAQIVSGIGFLGAGIIIFRRGSVHGLTTAAAVWESAAIGMAAGAGLLLLACTVTAMHFLIVLGFMPLTAPPRGPPQRFDPPASDLCGGSQRHARSAGRLRTSTGGSSPSSASDAGE